MFATHLGVTEANPKLSFQAFILLCLSLVWEEQLHLLLFFFFWGLPPLEESMEGMPAPR